jgi:hypothetical protein
MRSSRLARLIIVGAQGEEHIKMVEQAPMAEAGTCIVLPVHREEVRAPDRGVAADDRGCGLEKHMAIVEYLKSEQGMGHGHANALVGWTLAGNVASP